MAWYTRIYNWVTDRNNGVPITASRMDGEFDGVATALNSLHSFLATAEWVPEENTVAWASSTQFTVAGVDVTLVYHVGRRVKILHDTGGATVYGTVTASAFSTNTTVTVAVDGGIALLSTITAVSYGLLSYINPSYLDPRSIVLASVTSSQAYTGASGPVTVAFDTETTDTLDEFDLTTHKFTAKHPGYYLINVNINFTQTGTGQPFAVVSIIKNITTVAAVQNVVSIATASGGSNSVFSKPVSLVKGDTISVTYDGQLTGLIAGSSTLGSWIDIIRIA